MAENCRDGVIQQRRLNVIYVIDGGVTGGIMQGKSIMLLFTGAVAAPSATPLLSRERRVRVIEEEAGSKSAAINGCQRARTSASVK